MLNGSAPQADQRTIPTELYQAVIGDQAQGYYLAYFRRADERGYAPMSWHWPALLFAMPWMLYRRNYRWAFICLGFPYFATFAGLLLDGVAPGFGPYLFLTLLGGFQLVFLPLYGNAIHYWFARQLIENARSLHPGQQQKQIEYLRNRGGTSLAAPLFALAALLLLFSLAQPGVGT